MSFIKRNSLELKMVAIVVALITAMVMAANSNSREYTEACEKSGGKAVYNGKHWECLK